MQDSRRFKIAFPQVTMPPQYGGKRAIVLYSMAPKGDMSGVQMSTCVDTDGRIHQHVPFHITAIRAASMNPVEFLEVEKGNAPLVKVGET